MCYSWTTKGSDSFKNDNLGDGRQERGKVREVIQEGVGKEWIHLQKECSKWRKKRMERAMPQD